MYNMSMLRHWFSNEWCVCACVCVCGGGGGGGNHVPLLFRKSVYRIKHHLKMINALHERKTYQSVNLALAGDLQQNNDQLASRSSQLKDINSQLTNIN